MQRVAADEQVRKITDDFVADLMSQVKIDHHTDPWTEAEVITVIDRKSERPLLTFRRYRWKPMLAWFQKSGFTVAYARCSLIPKKDLFGMGVILLALT